MRRYFILLFNALILGMNIHAQGFLQAVDRYFTEESTSIISFDQYLGKDIAVEELVMLARKYPSDGFKIIKSKYSGAVLYHNEQILIYSIYSVKEKTGAVYKIVDVKGIEVGTQKNVWCSNLWRNPNDDNVGYEQIVNTFGILVIDKGMKVPFEKKLEPSFILTLTKDGMILIQKPDSRVGFMIMSREE